MNFNYLDILPDDILIKIFDERANKIEKEIELVYFIIRFCKEMTNNKEVMSDDEDFKNIDWINNPIWDQDYDSD